MKECSMDSKKQKTEINSSVALITKLHRFSTVMSRDEQHSRKVDEASCSFISALHD